MSLPIHTYHLRSGVWQRYSVPGGSGPQLWIGATVTDGSANNDISHFQTSNSIIGPLRVRRTYVPNKDVAHFPTDITATDAGDDLTAGIHPFLSVKGDPAGLANGDYDGVIAQLAATFPTTSPCWFTLWHEPEDNMTAAEFVAAFQRFYTVAKTANSNITIGPIHMTYQWRPGSTTTTVPDDWYVGSSYCDFLAGDSYWDTWRGATPQALANDSYHMRWHDWASTKGKPLYIPERGIRPLGPAAAAVLLQDETWMKANNYQMILYWDAVGTGNINWIIDNDPDMSSAWQQIASRGRSS